MIQRRGSGNCLNRNLDLRKSDMDVDILPSFLRSITLSYQIYHVQKWGVNGLKPSVLRVIRISSVIISSAGPLQVCHQV